MFILFLIGFLVGTYVVVLFAKFIGGALKPSLPTLEAPVKKVVIRRRTLQVVTRAGGSQPSNASMTTATASPRPKVLESGVAEPLLTM